MSSINNIKAVIVPQNKQISNSILINDLTYCAHRTINFNMLVFPKNGHVSFEINFKNYDVKFKLEGFFKDCGYISMNQFFQKNHSSFFADTDRYLGRFKAVVIDENYRIFGEL